MGQRAALSNTEPGASANGAREGAKRAPDGYQVVLSIGLHLQRLSLVSYTRRWMSVRRDRHDSSCSELRSLKAAGGDPVKLELDRTRKDFRERVTAEFEDSCQEWTGFQATIRRTTTARLSLGRQGPEAVDPRGYLAPTLVPSLIRRFGAFKEGQVLLAAKPCDYGGLEALIDCLRNPSRTMPALVVSPAVGGRPVLKPDALAAAAAGLAHVYTLADDLVAHTFCEEMGEAFDCCGGTVRLYWPGLSDGDPLSRHRRWLPYYILNERRTFVLDVMQELARGVQGIAAAQRDAGRVEEPVDRPYPQAVADRGTLPRDGE